MRKVVAAIGFASALMLSAAGCNPNHVFVDWEGPNWFLVHPNLDCLYCPYANPRCPYYDYDKCQWSNGPETPTVSATNAPPVAKKIEDEVF